LAHKHFEVHIFNPSRSANAPVTRVGKHELIKIWGGYVDWREQLVEEFKRQVGRMLITGNMITLFYLMVD
jgi:hypothetical protein